MSRARRQNTDTEDKKKFNILDIFMKDKHTKTMGVILIMAACIVGYLELDYIIPEYVHVEYSTMDETKEIKTSTRVATVGDLLDELDIETSDIDVVYPAKSTEVHNRMNIKVAKCEQTEARIEGKDQKFILMPGTVEDNLKHNNISYDEDDSIKPALDKAVSAKTRIEVKEIHYKVKEKKEKVEAEYKVILDPSVASGTILETEGEDGEAVFTYKTKYVNGKKKETRKKVKKWIHKAQDHVLTLGTSATGESGTATVTKEFTAETTAYTAGPGARGSTGQTVHYGTCAVDPSVIPYGSLLYVEGYGTAIANDCGGAVRGYIVDLYLNSTSACIQWGRRNCRAYIISR